MLLLKRRRKRSRVLGRRAFLSHCYMYITAYMLCACLCSVMYVYIFRGGGILCWIGVHSCLDVTEIQE